MVKEETLGRGPKGGGKEELGEEEWVSLNIHMVNGVATYLITGKIRKP